MEKIVHKDNIDNCNTQNEATMILEINKKINSSKKKNICGMKIFLDELYSKKSYIDKDNLKEIKLLNNVNRINLMKEHKYNKQNNKVIINNNNKNKSEISKNKNIMREYLNLLDSNVKYENKYYKKEIINFNKDFYKISDNQVDFFNVFKIIKLDGNHQGKFYQIGQFLDNNNNKMTKIKPKVITDNKNHVLYKTHLINNISNESLFKFRDKFSNIYGKHILMKRND